MLKKVEKKLTEKKIGGYMIIRKYFFQFDNDLVIVCLVAFVMACLLLCLGFHPSVLILLMSRSMFLTSRLSSLLRRPVF